MLRNKKNYLHTLYISVIYLQQPVTVYKTSTYSTHDTRLHRCSVWHNHLHYHITTGIGIGTRIGIGAGKKYRVSGIGSIGKSWYRSQPTHVPLWLRPC